jgi:hypothetical protein
MATVKLSSLEAVEAAVLQHLLSALERTPVHEAPFSHFYLEDAFPQEVYSRLLEQLPEPTGYRSGRADRHTRDDGVVTKGSYPLTAETLQRLPDDQRELWGGISAALSSPKLQHRVFTMLATDLSRRFRISRDRVHEIVAYPRSALIRNLGGYQIAPHPDGSSKIVTMQFYLAPDLTQIDLGTAVYERHLFRLKTLLDPKSRFVKVKQFPFQPNSGYGFAVSRWSWHGREPVPMTAGVRNTILHIYFNDPNKLAS